MILFSRLLRRLGLLLVRPIDRRRVRVPKRTKDHVASNMWRYMSAGQIKAIKGALKK